MVRGGVPIQRYGCVTGRFVALTRDNPKPGKYGQYYHGHMKVGTPGGTCECAVDVSTPEGKPMLFTVITPLSNAFFATARALKPGVHALASTPGSGALDYLRAAALKVKGWKKSSAVSVLDQLEDYGRRSRRVWVFGDRYPDDKGAHDVHMNQGDPAGSKWFAANGVWQDGGTVFLLGESLIAVLTRFDDQSVATDASGNPV